MASIEGLADADVAAGGMVLPGHKAQLDLELVRVRVAAVGRLEDGTVVAAAGREQLGGMVDLGELGAPLCQLRAAGGVLAPEQRHTSPPMTRRTPFGTWLITPSTTVKS